MNYLGLSIKNSTAVVKELNNLMCNYQIYYQNLRNYHWNITGEHFFELHVKFEELYNEAKLNIDAIAERILTLRLKPASTLAEYLKNSKIKEKSVSSSSEMVKNILGNHKILISNMRSILKVAGDNKDEGTVDMISGFMSSLEKNSWMLDAWSTK